MREDNRVYPAGVISQGRIPDVKNGVGLMVDGAYFVIADHYRHPVGLIYLYLREYWGGRSAN